MQNLNLNFKKIAVIAYIVLSAIFILYVLYQNFQINVMQSSYNRGMGDAITQLMQEAEKCEAFPIHIGDKEIRLQPLDCKAATPAQ